MDRVNLKVFARGHSSSQRNSVMLGQKGTMYFREQIDRPASREPGYKQRFLVAGTHGTRHQPLLGESQTYNPWRISGRHPALAHTPHFLS